MERKRAALTIPPASQPLVETADGVREIRNDRVEIGPAEAQR